VSFFYPTPKQHVSAKNAEYLSLLAHEYQVTELSRQCTKFLLRQPATVEICLLADKCNYGEVVENCVKNMGVANQAPSIAKQRDKWAALSPAVLVKIVEKAGRSFEARDRKFKARDEAASKFEKKIARLTEKLRLLRKPNSDEDEGYNSPTESEMDIMSSGDEAHGVVGL
jgi:hypothetical protein